MLGDSGTTQSDMDRKRTLTLRKIFRYLMENGYYPTYEKTHITYDIDGNIGILEYDEDILSIRLFFSIDKEEYDQFLEASNSCMLKSYIVKPAILEDSKTIMFSCENVCCTYRDFDRFFPKMMSLLRQSIKVHKEEMKQLLIADQIVKATLPATEDGFLEAGSVRKVLS